MPIEQTLFIIKPDAVQKNIIGQILHQIETQDLKVIAASMQHLSEDEAKAFYAVHAKRPFYEDLVTFMISGPILITVLEGENAILKTRKIMGATNPKDAEAGTLRAKFAESIERNVVHGSDGPETAKTEIAFFFSPQEILSR